MWRALRSLRADCGDLQYGSDLEVLATATGHGMPVHVREYAVARVQEIRQMTSVPTPLPSSWVDVDPLTGDDDDVRALLRDPAHPLVAIVRATPRGEGAALAKGFRSALGAHGLFSYPQDHGALHATAMLAAWIGFDPVKVHEDLGGMVTIVRSGLGGRADQKWHTDSTPWRRPNRLTLLGQIHLAEGCEAPATELLPFATVDDALSVHPEALQILRSSPVPWRGNLPNLSGFDAPILAIDTPRWLETVLDQCGDDLPVDLQAAVGVFRSTIGALPPVGAVVEPGQLLLFDNYANLHRGPNIEQDLERSLVRIKIGGAAD